MISTQDLEHGIDFTGINPATGADHNTLIDQATPGTDVGLVVRSFDSALDTPDVPDATVVEKWKKYIWLRIPHNSASDRTPITYGWNDDVVSVPITLKWVPLIQDITALISQINNIEDLANSAVSTASVANSTAAAANTNASNALNKANLLETDVATANSNAANAVQTANAAKTVADAAKVAADDAAAAVGGKRDPSAALTPGTSDQYVRTKLDASAAEWGYLSQRMALVTEESSSADGHAGENVRALNTVKKDAGGLLNGLSGGAAVLNYAGTYLVIAGSAFCHVTDCQLIIQQNGQNAGPGLSVGNTAGQGGIATAIAILTCAAGETIGLNHYIHSVYTANKALGEPSGSSADCFAYMFIHKIA